MPGEGGENWSLMASRGTLPTLTARPGCLQLHITTNPWAPTHFRLSLILGLLAELHSQGWRRGMDILFLDGLRCKNRQQLPLAQRQP